MADQQLIRKIQKLRQTDPPTPFSSIAQTLGKGTTKDKIQKIAKKYCFADRPVRPDYPAPLTLEGNWAIAGDIHAEAADPDVVEEIPNTASQHGVRNLLIAGDLFNFHQFSKYSPLRWDTPFQGEKEAVRKILTFWGGCFDRMVWMIGNHDKRFVDFTKGATSLDDIANMVLPANEKACVTPRQRLETTMYNYVNINTDAGRWYITHAYEYSIVPLSVAQKLCMVEHCHVMTHHQHHVASGYDRGGRFNLVDNGCVADPEMLGYSLMNASSKPKHERGWCMLIDGKPVQYSKP